jgi:ABC-type multidrug transport system fused ATPase/permease subunit
MTCAISAIVTLPHIDGKENKLLRQSLKSLLIVWKYAKLPVSFKIAQSILTAILTPISIYFTQTLIDSIEAYAHNTMSIWTVMGRLGLLILSVLFLASTGFFDSLLHISLQRSINQNLSLVIVQKFMRLEYCCFEDKNIADTINRMGGSPHNKMLDIFSNTLNTITLLITIFGTALVFAQVSIWFSLLFLAMLIPMLWLDFKAIDMMNTLFNSQSEQERKLGYLSGLLNSKNSLFELKIFGAIDYILTRWREINKKVLHERVKTTIYSQKYFAISTLLIILWSGCVVAFLIWNIYYSAISIGIFIALIGSVGTILGLSEALSRSFSALSQQHLEIKHYNTFLSLPEIDNAHGETDIVESGKLHIVFEDIHFTYPNTDKEILRGLSLEILPHQRVSLVGENGAGKSTIIKLLCKLYKPNSGRIMINGIDIYELSTEKLNKAYSIVFQDYVAYSLTLRENIAFGNIARLHDSAAIENALQQGLASELLAALPNGIDTNLGKLEKDGVDLSGGQWQRIAISRACLSDSALVILDEPTAALDPVVENEMYEAFSSVLKTKGCIMISHRLSSVKLSDTIHVIHDGVIVEKGTHKELMAKNGLYKEMFSAQSSWYLKDEE